MGFLDKLWDDIVAGPRPEKGLGRLRKQNSLKQGAVDAAEEEEGGSIDRRRSADFQYQQQDDGRIDRRRSADFQLQQQDRGRIDRRRSADFQFRQDEARRVTQSIAIAKPPALQPINSPDDPSSSLPSTPVAQSPLSASWSPSGREKDNIWRSVFHPGSNKAGMDRMGSSKFDKQSPNSPTVYDWLYSHDTKSKWR